MAWLIAVALGSVLAGYLYLLAFRSHAVFMVKATAALQVLLPLAMGAAAMGATGSVAAASPFFLLAGMAALAMYLWYATLCASNLRTTYQYSTYVTLL